MAIPWAGNAAAYVKANLPAHSANIWQEKWQIGKKGRGEDGEGGYGRGDDG